ncbi:hypothetical protein BBJ28_00023970 [Nothophytophthora sp. Chile5]|nr:hypothetical protein BBJ28_00023970 [Nothophytophthora sp. Chile5]
MINAEPNVSERNSARFGSIRLGSIEVQGQPYCAMAGTCGRLPPLFLQRFKGGSIGKTEKEAKNATKMKDTAQISVPSKDPEDKGDKKPEDAKTGGPADASPVDEDLVRAVSPTL